MRPLSRIALTGATALIALVLAGCGDGGQQVQLADPPSRTIAPAPTPSGDQTGPPTSEGGPAAGQLNGIPVGTDCIDVLSLDAIYEYNPNVGTDSRVQPTALGQRAIESEGVACGWSNQTSGEPLTIAIARFNDDDLSIVRASAVAAPGSETLPEASGVFRREGESGIVEAFSGEYWIVLESPAFFSYLDAAPLLESIKRSFD